MTVIKLTRSAAFTYRMAHLLSTGVRPSRSVVTWAEQDHWEDPRGPLGIDRPSPKLAPLTAESPQWLSDLQRDGVSCSAHPILQKFVL